MSSVIEPGAVIEEKYRVLRRIGEGGMGTVYEGENTRIERRVAIKVLHAHVASSPEFALRFEREARASARIGSQYVCDVLDLGDLPNGDRYIVMEYLDGESLEERLDRGGKMTAQELAPIAFELLDGLGSMHQAGVVHRDLKPANVFLAKTSRGRTMVKILDFGVAKIVPRADESGGATQTGMMMGTPLYMSPEQARGARDVDGRTDLYAASVIFYRALTGVLPHEAVNLHELLFKIVLEDPRPILKLAPDVDPEFAAIVTKGLIRDVNVRYTSAREYQEALADWGAKQALPQLRFSVTLPSERPPLRTFTAFPAEPTAETQPSPGRPSTPPPAPMPAIPPAPPTPSEATATPNDHLRPRFEGPPTPVKPGVGISQTLVAGAVPTPGQAGGTPMGWSEDRPLDEAEARSLPGGTVVFKSTPPPRPSSLPPPQPERLDIPVPSSMPASSVASSGGRVPNVPMVTVPTTRIAVGGAVAIAILAAAVGARVMNTPTPATTPSAEVPTRPASVATLPAQVPDPPATVESTPSAEPSVNTSPAVSVQRPVTAARDASAPLWLPPTTSPKPSAAPPPSVAPVSSHRKFRVDL